MSEEGIVNRVANSGLKTIDLEELIPEGERVLLDIKDQLWQGLALKEKDFRAYIKEQDWSEYQDKYVAIHCSVDALIPTWAYMLLSTSLAPFAKKVVFGNLEKLEENILNEALDGLDMAEFEGARVVVKGCSDKAVPQQAYVKLASLLHKQAKSILFGEPCSTVPIWKQRPAPKS